MEKVLFVLLCNIYTFTTLCKFDRRRLDGISFLIYCPRKKGFEFPYKLHKMLNLWGNWEKYVKGRLLKVIYYIHIIIY